ncbi:S1/P1 nuclease [Rhypophila decipiens]|uniref:S1/P1 nuclease n=1 Tax=Rhypophila decipiens TaxID=261697 RepID=A0AAN7BCZ1_9PEZI|nr:S1/P1 nuclease [Rhypophila decipiens]
MRSQALFLALAAVAAPVAAWDPFGHQTVGYLASKYFSESTAAHLTSLIGLSDRFDIGDAAAWADTVRDADGLPWSKNWHFINPRADNPATNTCKLEYPSDCPKGNCIIDAILNQTRAIMNPSLSASGRRNATMWVLHFFGDLHQPMHASGYKYGGNLVRPVCFGPMDQCNNGTSGDRVLSLHSIWDSAIPRKLRGLKAYETPAADKEAARLWAEDIYESQQAQADGTEEAREECGSMGCVVDWATESNRLVCEHALSKGEQWVLTHDLSGDYFLENAKVVQSQVGKAGRRLAQWMNALADILDQLPPVTEATRGEGDGYPTGDL